MDRDELIAALGDFSSAFGPPGHENEVAELFRRRLDGTCQFYQDRLGSTVAELPGAGPRVMLAAHLDEVGLMIKAVTPEGYLRFVPLGTWWSQVLLSGMVRVRGRKGEVRGVIGSKPPHFFKENEGRTLMPMEDMFIDVAAGSREEVAALGLGPGDPAVPDISPVQMASGAVLMGKALDDRVGILAISETARHLAGSGHPNALFAVGTVQEEIGGRGARTAAQMLKPDVCLVVEGTPADDSPGFAREMSQGVLGHGPQIRIFDPSMIANRPLVEMAIDAAVSAGLPYQIAVREGGGTDGGPIHVIETGVPTLVIGIPVRYAHSQAGMTSLSDLEQTIQLLTIMVEKLDGQTVGRLTGMPG